MAFTPIPNGVRIVHLGRIGNVPIVNTVGCVNGAGANVGDSLASLAKKHGDAWRAKIMPLLWSSYGHEATLAYSMENQSAAAGDAGYTGVVSGGDTSAPGPASSAVCVALKTAKRGRTYQGRMFLGAICINNMSLDGQTWTPAAVAKFATAVLAYKNQVDPTLGGNGRMAILTHGSPAKGIPAGAEPVTGIIVRPGLATQRRRLT